MSKETRLFINMLSHSIAAGFCMYKGYQYLDESNVSTWCFISASWIIFTAYRTDQLIKMKHDFNQVIQEAMQTALEIKESVNTLKVQKVTKDLHHGTV